MLPHDADELWDEQEEKKTFAKVMLPFLLLGFLKGVENTTDRPPETLLTPPKRKLFQSKSAAYAAATLGTTKEALQALIDNALENGYSAQKLAKNIKDSFGKMEGYRSLRIARTQLTNTINDGTEDGLRVEGYQFKEWSTVIDGRERESHHRANGQVVPIEQTFKLDGGECMYPGDDSLPPSESINCRCTVVAPDMGRGWKHFSGMRFLRTHGALERRYVVSLRRAFREQRDRVLSSLL